MFAVAVLFGLPILVGGAMIKPQPISIRALISYWGVMALIMPFACWPLFIFQLTAPTAGRNRITAVLNVWFFGTTLGVSVIYWLSSLLSYDPSGRQVEFVHRVVPYMPKTGIAVGLFGLCMLVSCGLWGVLASIIRPQVTVAGAAITGCVLFILLYGGGWLLFAI
jgi:hypothetical protein